MPDLYMYEDDPDLDCTLTEYVPKEHSEYGRAEVTFAGFPEERHGIVVPPELSLAHELAHHEMWGKVHRTATKNVIEDELNAWEQVMRWKIPVGHWGSRERQQATALLGSYYKHHGFANPRKTALKALYEIETRVREAVD